MNFNRIPNNLRVPGVYSEIDNSNAISGAQLLEYRRLLIGTVLDSGTMATGVPTLITSADQGVGLAGAGSVLAGQIEAAFAFDRFTETWAIGLEDSGGAKASATLTVTGPATAAGTIALLVAGRAVSVNVALADAASAIATKVAAAINAAARLPVTAAAAAGVVTLTAKNGGETGNSLDVRAGYYDETLPAGVGITVTAFTGGTGNPDVGDALAAAGDGWYQAVASAYADQANLVLLIQDQDDRWGPLREVEGHVFAGVKGTVASVGTFGGNFNSEHLTLVEAIASPTPAYELAAESAAIWAFRVANDPARPVQNINYAWSKAPAKMDQLSIAERNILLYDGIATTKVTPAGVLQAERFITTYKMNEAGGTDVSYLDSETLATLLYLRHDWRDRLLRKFPNAKLADDGNRFGSSAGPIVTPKSMKAEQVAWAIGMQDIGLIENIDSFKKLSLSERNLADRNRLDNLLVPDLVNQLRIVANKIQFIL